MKDSTRRRLEALEQTVQPKKGPALSIQVVFVGNGKQKNGPLFDFENDRVIVPEDWEGTLHPGWVRQEKGTHDE